MREFEALKMLRGAWEQQNHWALGSCCCGLLKWNIALLQWHKDEHDLVFLFTAHAQEELCSFREMYDHTGIGTYLDRLNGSAMQSDSS